MSDSNFTYVNSYSVGSPGSPATGDDSLFTYEAYDVGDPVTEFPPDGNDLFTYYFVDPISFALFTYTGELLSLSVSNVPWVSEIDLGVVT